MIVNARLAKKKPSYNQPLESVPESLNLLNQGNVAEAAKTVNDLYALLGWDLCIAQGEVLHRLRPSAASTYRPEPQVATRYFGDTQDRRGHLPG